MAERDAPQAPTASPPEPGPDPAGAAPEAPGPAASDGPGPASAGAPGADDTAAGSPPGEAGEPGEAVQSDGAGEPGESGEPGSGPEAAGDGAPAATGDSSAEAVGAGDEEAEAEPVARGGRSSMRAADRVLVKRITKERDDYLDQLRRTRADFENYRKRMLRQQTEHLERAAEALVEKLLPILDNFEAAIDHGQGFEQVHVTLMSVLGKEGLERVHPLGKPFDPTEADAVAHEDGDDGPVVAEVLRPGYRWKGRVVRPAMVRVRG